jgi:WD40 repeat protein
MKALYVTPLVLFLFLSTVQAQFRDIAWIRGGHSEVILSHAISPDGRLLVSGSADSTIKLWDIATANLLATLYGHRDAVTSVAFLPDGKSIISGSLDSTVRFWDVESRREGRVGNTGSSVLAVVYAPSINRLVTRQLDGSWNVRELKSGVLVSSFKAGGGLKAVYAWSSDGSMIATCAYRDSILRLWETGSGTLLHEINLNNRNGVMSLAFSPDGRTLVSGGFGDSLSIWDVEAGVFRRSIGKGSVSAPYELHFSSSGDTLYAGTRDGLVVLQIRNDIKLRQLNSLEEYSLGYVRPAFSIHPDGHHVIVNGSHNYGDMTLLRRPFLDLRELDSGQLVRTLTGHSSAITSLGFPTGDSLLISCLSERGEVRRWSTSGELQRDVNLSGADFYLNLSPEGEFLSVLSGSYETHFFLEVSDNLEQGRGFVIPQLFYSGFPSWVSPGGKYLFGSGIWDAATKQYRSEYIPSPYLTSHSSASFSPDATLLAIVQKNEVLLWNITSAKAERSLPFDAPATVAFSRDGLFIAAGSIKGAIMVWETSTGAFVRELSGHHGGVTALAFSGDSRYLVSAGADSTVRTWIIETGENDYTYDEYPSAQLAVAVTADGKHIASGSEDGSLIMWQARGAISSVPPQSITAGASTLRCYPTPASSLVNIECELARSGVVDVRIVDQLGREVAMLADGELQSGAYHFTWNAEGLPAGIYHCRLQRASERIVRQIVVVR